MAIARTVLRDARLVILDEPTAALGVAQTEQVLNLVRPFGRSGLWRSNDQPQSLRRFQGSGRHCRAVFRKHGCTAGNRKDHQQ